MHTAEQILDNVIWLVNALGDDALRDVQDIPMLEIARAVTIAPVRQRGAGPAQPARTRVRPRYPTSMTAALAIRRNGPKIFNKRRLML
jgi:hypothetical protein